MKGKKDSSVTNQRTRAQGLDYAFLAGVMAVGSFEFPGHLRDAAVDAVAYGSAWSETLKRQVPSVSLLAKRGKELSAAFEEFEAWARPTDSDAVELTFVFLKKGGYVLGISPEPQRLRRRCLGFDRAHRVVIVNGMWFKPMKSVHPALRQLRAYRSQSIAPFFFGGATYSGPRSALLLPSPPNVVPLPGREPLLKFEATLVDEDEAIPDTTGWVATRVFSRKRVRDRKPRLPTAEEIAKQRRATLARHFPVTLERLHQRGDLVTLGANLVSAGVRFWQIEQALCNLAISVEICKGPHFPGLRPREVTQQVTQTLASRCELADAGQVPEFTVDEVRTQIAADGNALLRSLQRKRRPNLRAVQAALARASALDADTVLGTHDGRSTRP